MTTHEVVTILVDIHLALAALGLFHAEDLCRQLVDDFLIRFSLRLCLGQPLLRRFQRFLFPLERRKDDRSDGGEGVLVLGTQHFQHHHEWQHVRRLLKEFLEDHGIAIGAR